LDDRSLNDHFGWTTHRHAPQGQPPNAILEQIKATHQQAFSVLGERLIFQTNDTAILEAAQRSFSRFNQTSQNDEFPMVISLFVHPASDRPGFDEHNSHRPPVYRTHGHLLYITAGGESTAVVDFRSGYAMGFISRSVADDAAFLRFTFIECIAYSLISANRQFLPVHAACVFKDHTSLVLKGASASGKSTLCMACLRRGYQILSEDTVFLKGDADQLEIWGNPWQIHLLPESQRYFPEIAGEKPRLQVNAKWKIEVDTEDRFPGSTIQRVPPGPIVFLERATGGGTPCLQRISPEEASTRLDFAWPYGYGWTKTVEATARAFLRQPAYRLALRGAPDEAVDALDELISQWKYATQ
jgi:hypothetical protein